MSELLKYVTYEAFGAAGDGETDDAQAIHDAHEYANAHDLPVITKPDATYYIGPRALPAYIETDVDWSTSRFTIDDTAVENNKVACFIVRSRLQPEELSIKKLSRDQKQLDVYPKNDCLVTVYNDNVKHFIRFGLNQGSGEAARDTFLLHTDGSIYGPIDWDHETVTRVEAQPVDKEPLTIKGGVFTTIANRAPSTYNYYARNISVQRSRTTIDGLTHHVACEISHGAPYSGFIQANACAFFTLQNTFLTGHKIYQTIGSAGKPVSMGSYDLNAHSVLEFTCRNCRILDIYDSTRWGIIGSNFSKNMLVENCDFSRLDAHMGVSGYFTVRNCRLGHHGFNAIGRGTLSVENTTVNGHNFLNFRDDYGSHWEGDIVIKNCTWVPSCGKQCKPTLFRVTNSGMHDFGYACSMPTRFTVDGLHVEDINTTEDYQGLELFSDPDIIPFGVELEITDPRPYPYKPAEEVMINGLTCASGKPVYLSDNPAFYQHTKVVVNGTVLSEGTCEDTSC